MKKRNQPLENLERVQAFAWALTDGTAEDVQRMLAEGMDPSGDDEEGFPFIAYCLGRPEKLRALLEAGADVNMRLRGWPSGHSVAEDLEDLTLLESIICALRLRGWIKGPFVVEDLTLVESVICDLSIGGKLLPSRLECLKLLLDHGAPAQVREEIEIPAPMRAYLAHRLAQDMDTVLPLGVGGKARARF